MKGKLGKRAIAKLIAVLKAGLSECVLAGRHGIGEESIETLPREHGVRKRAR
jgi:hypothetical protein